MKNKEENRYKRLVSDIFIFVIGTVLAKAIQFVLMPLYTSYMTTETYGAAELTNNLSELFFPVATLCIYEAAFRYAVDPEFDNKYLATISSEILIKSSVLGGIAALTAKFVFNYEQAFYLFFILYSYSFRMTMAYYIRGTGKAQIFAISGIINAVSLGIFNIIFLVLFDAGETGYLLSIGLSYCTSAIYLFVYGRIPKEIDFHINDKREERNILFRYCLPLIFYNVLYWFITISGRYILMLFTDTSTVGKYVAAIKITAIVNMIQQAVYAALQLNSSRIFTDDDKEKYYTKINNIFISIYLFLGSVIICFIPVLARLTLKNDFYDAKIFLPAIMLGSLINCISSLLSAMYSAYKKTSNMVSVSIIGAVINIGVGMILTPYMGIWGVCIASILCYISQVLYKAYDINKFCRLNYNYMTIIPSFLLLLIQVFILSFDINYKYILSITLMLFIFFINLKMMLNTIRLLN